jgi:DHA3 family tetracycline resistance protein-like MFS transporter
VAAAFHKANLVHSEGATRVYLLYSLLTAMFFALYATYNMVYYVDRLQLDALRLVLIGTTLEVTAFLCEVPTGIVADLYSRKLSIIIGHLFIGLGFVVSAIPDFTYVLLAQVIWGLGWTFTSGATGAWITDEIGEERVGPVFMRGAQAGSIGGLLGVLVGTALVSFGLHVPLVAGGVLHMVLALLLVVIMRETGFTPASRTSHNPLRQMSATFRSGMRAVRGRSILILLLAVSLFWGMASEGYDRLWQKLMLDNFSFPLLGDLDPVTWFGVFSVAGSLLAIAANEVARRRVNTRDPQALGRALRVLSGALVASMVVFALAGSFNVAVIALLAFGMLRSVNWPLFDTWVNQLIDSRVRATVLSMTGQVDAIGQITAGPVLGMVGLNLSVRAAIFISALLLSPILLLYSRALRRPQPVEEVALT